jgi:hypothetical protein
MIKLRQLKDNNPDKPDNCLKDNFLYKKTENPSIRH